MQRPQRVLGGLVFRPNPQRRLMSGSHSNYGASTSRPLPLNVGDVKGKGKGKQRADVDLENQDHSGRHSDGRDDEELAGMSFSIRFTDGTNEDLLDVYVGPNESVRQLKARIRLLRTNLATNRLRLIYLGRIITDGTRLVPWIVAILKRQSEQEAESQRLIAGIDFSAIEGAVKSAVNSLDDTQVDLEKGQHTGPSKGKSKEPDIQSDKQPGRDKKIWLHCSVGEPGSIEEETEVSAHKQEGQVRPATGFDRLREAGFSDEDIENIRQQFHVDGPADTTVTGDEDEHARALEEQWMDSFNSGGMDTGDTTRGMYRALFKGVVAGFFFPFLPLFFFRRGQTIFSKRMQMAIVAGCSINLLYGTLRAFA